MDNKIDTITRIVIIENVCVIWKCNCKLFMFHHFLFFFKNPKNNKPSVCISGYLFQIHFLFI